MSILGIFFAFLLFTGGFRYLTKRTEEERVNFIKNGVRRINNLFYKLKISNNTKPIAGEIAKIFHEIFRELDRIKNIDKKRKGIRYLDKIINKGVEIEKEREENPFEPHFSDYL